MGRDPGSRAAKAGFPDFGPPEERLSGLHKDLKGAIVKFGRFFGPNLKSLQRIGESNAVFHP